MNCAESDLATHISPVDQETDVFVRMIQPGDWVVGCSMGVGD